MVGVRGVVVGGVVVGIGIGLVVVVAGVVLIVIVVTIIREVEVSLANVLRTREGILSRVLRILGREIWSIWISSLCSRDVVPWGSI